MRDFPGINAGSKLERAVLRERAEAAEARVGSAH